jgi:hypothetical protein
MSVQAPLLVLVPETSVQKEEVAISRHSFNQHGCVSCGFSQRGYHMKVHDRAVVWCCTDRSSGKPCDQVMHILESGVYSPFPVPGKKFELKLRPHPRKPVLFTIQLCRARA